MIDDVQDRSATGRRVEAPRDRPHVPIAFVGEEVAAEEIAAERAAAIDVAADHGGAGRSTVVAERFGERCERGCGRRHAGGGDGALANAPAVVLAAAARRRDVDLLAVVLADVADE